MISLLIFKVIFAILIDGSPHTWTDSSDDIDQLKHGKALGHKFSRKFDLEKYPEMTELIKKIIHMKAEEL